MCTCLLLHAFFLQDDNTIHSIFNKTKVYGSVNRKYCLIVSKLFCATKMFQFFFHCCTVIEANFFGHLSFLGFCINIHNSFFFFRIITRPRTYDYYYFFTLLSHSLYAQHVQSSKAKQLMYKYAWYYLSAHFFKEQWTQQQPMMIYF